MAFWEMILDSYLTIWGNLFPPLNPSNCADQQSCWLPPNLHKHMTWITLETFKTAWNCFCPGYRPCDPDIIQDRMSTLKQSYEELCELAESRRKRLEESRTLWQFYWDMADEEGWIREKEQLMSSPDLGHDLTSVNLLLSKHKVRHWRQTSHCFV